MENVFGQSVYICMKFKASINNGNDCCHTSQEQTLGRFRFRELAGVIARKDSAVFWTDE